MSHPGKWTRMVGIRFSEVASLVGSPPTCPVNPASWPHPLCFFSGIKFFTPQNIVIPRVCVNEITEFYEANRIWMHWETCARRVVLQGIPLSSDCGLVKNKHLIHVCWVTLIPLIWVNFFLLLRTLNYALLTGKNIGEKTATQSDCRRWSD